MTPDERNQHSATIAVLIVALGAIVFGSYTLVVRSAHDAIAVDTAFRAEDWANRLGALPGIDNPLRGTRPPRWTERVIVKAAAEGMFKLKLFDEEGRLRYDSERISDGGGLVTSTEVAADARQVFESGEPMFSEEMGDGVSRPRHYSEVYVPLEIDGARVGTIEAYFEQSSNMERMQAVLGRTARKIAVAAGLVFLIPALALIWSLRRTTQSRAQLAHAARHDAMTGLLNRRSFSARIEETAARFRGGGEFRVLFIDLDKFKEVNDSRGHAAGDELLRQVARRIQECTGPGDVVCRLGGDEFAIMEPFPDGIPENPTLARRLIASLSEPFAIGGDDLRIGASIGVSEFPRDAGTASELLRAADLALYEAKGQGRGQHFHYVPEMEKRRAEREAIDRCIRNAIDGGTFDVHYQPLMRTADRSLHGYEALIRISDANGNPVPPSRLIPIAEETELIVPLGEQILRRVCEEAVTWGRDDLMVSVNLSPVQFKSGDLPQTVRRILEDSGFPAERLTLEMTESVLLADVDGVAMQLDALKELGVLLALDDFGTGYSSLSYLWRFPFDCLKIDRSFVAQMEKGDDRSRRIMETMVVLGEVLDLTVTVEGVETDAQDREVRRMNVDAVQGFYYGCPSRVPEHLDAPPQRQRS